MRAILKLPPDGSFLSSTVYEGVLRLLAAGARVEAGDVLVTEPEVVKRAYEEVAKAAGERLRLANTGRNDVKYVKKLLSVFGIDYDAVAPRKKSGEIAMKISYGAVIRAIASSDRGWDGLGDTELALRVDKRKGIILVGTGKKEALQLPVFKPDRYKGLRLPEAGITHGMYQFGIGIEAAVIGLLGLGGAHVASLGSSHYFLFIDPSHAAHVIASSLMGMSPARLARTYLAARDAGAEALRSLEDALVYPEAAVSRLLLDVGVRRALREGNIRMLSLRLVRVDEEGRTYKVYSETPVTVAAEEAEYAEVLLKHLDPARSPLMSCLIREAMKVRRANVRTCEEGQHAVEAVMWLFRYVSTGSKYFLSQYLRELVTAASVAEASEGGARRAPLYRGLAATLLRVMK